jgi:hypothetical protein
MLRGMKGKLRVAYADVYKERSMPIGSRDRRALSLLWHLVSDVDAWMREWFRY